MAERVTRRASKSAAAKAAAGDLEILHPERRILVGAGKAEREITVREYGFVEGLQLRAHYQIFLDALTGVLVAGSSGASLEAVEDVFASHTEAVIPLVAKAADVDVAFVNSLSDEDGRRLMQTWWVVNYGFFIRRLTSRLAADQLAQRAVAQLGSRLPRPHRRRARTHTVRHRAPDRTADQALLPRGGARGTPPPRAADHRHERSDERRECRRAPATLERG